MKPALLALESGVWHLLGNEWQAEACVYVYQLVSHHSIAVLFKLFLLRNPFQTEIFPGIPPIF
jgi:hypothetical protein